jgi:hypothetical protein
LFGEGFLLGEPVPGLDEYGEDECGDGVEKDKGADNATWAREVDLGPSV